MPYRMGRGDYYRGDYYRGSIFSAIGSVFKPIGKVVGGALSGLISGGPIGGIAGAIGGAVGSIASDIGSSGAAAPVGSSNAATPAKSLDQSPEALVRQHQLNVAHAQAGKKGGRAISGPGAVGVMPAVPALVGAGGRRRRHMRVTNTKALYRALRRAEGFKKVALKTIRLIDPHRKAKSFHGFKTRRRK